MTSLIVSPSKSADNNKQLLSNHSFVLLICKRPNEERRAGLSSKVPEKIKKGKKKQQLGRSELVGFVGSGGAICVHTCSYRKGAGGRIRFYRPDRRATRQHKIIILVPDDVQGLAERISFLGSREGRKKSGSQGPNADKCSTAFSQHTHRHRRARTARTADTR